jgi:hypothetical protein
MVPSAARCTLWDISWVAAPCGLIYRRITVQCVSPFRIIGLP